MGFEDDDFENARKRMNENLYKGNDRSSSQLYKQAGNSIVVDVLLHIMENLYDAMPYLFDGMVVGSFFSGIGAFEKALTRLQTEPHEYSSISKEDMPNLQQVGYINDYNCAQRCGRKSMVIHQELCMEKIRIKQATKKGYIECLVGGGC